ncbi:hypothetical protein [Natronorarus salvus]|uniref:hypothetical protein n=1 Tax=Natronorarus salvus TaxID=3117733 RepID=UPI002F25EBCA
MGYNRTGYENALEIKTDDLLSIGADSGMIYNDEDEIETDRDYRLVWDSNSPSDIKPMVKRKYISNQIPKELGRLALERAKDEFTSEYLSLTDF